MGNEGVSLPQPPGKGPATQEVPVSGSGSQEVFSKKPSMK